jgi:adenine deaminase
MKRFKLTALMLATTLLAGAAAPSGQADVVIKGGTIYDGGTGKPFVGDVAIKGDRILYVGPHSPCAPRRPLTPKA